MAATDTTRIIGELYSSACLELFESLDCVASATDEPHNSELTDAPIANIDAGSEDLEITLNLRLPTSILALTYPVTGAITDVSEEELEDWLSELSNQFMGRLKAKLHSRQCNVKLGLPVSHFDTDISELLSGKGHHESLYFMVDQEPCECHLTVELFNEDLIILEEAVEDPDAIGEGEMELF